ncbi:MAG: hypothetical protein LBP59_02460 [Planctomycetaceae bacterium]|nr:hypothetical protein [Planctomycetaceae bacterium]
MSTTACRRDARDPGMQARRPRSWNTGETPAILQTNFYNKTTPYFLTPKKIA